jgi:hypothetical protein
MVPRKVKQSKIRPEKPPSLSVEIKPTIEHGKRTEAERTRRWLTPTLIVSGLAATGWILGTGMNADPKIVAIIASTFAAPTLFFYRKSDSTIK